MSIFPLFPSSFLSLFFFCTLEQARRSCFSYFDFFFFFPFKNPCGSSPCNGRMICQTGFTPKGYRCMCPAGFTGQDCKTGRNATLVLMFLTKCFIATADLEMQVLKLLKDPNDRRVCFNFWLQLTIASPSVMYHTPSTVPLMLLVCIQLIAALKCFASRPIPIVLVECWKVAHWNAKKLLKKLPKIQKVATKISKVAA